MFSNSFVYLFNDIQLQKRKKVYTFKLLFEIVLVVIDCQLPCFTVLPKRLLCLKNGERDTANAVAVVGPNLTNVGVCWSFVLVGVCLLLLVPT